MRHAWIYVLLAAFITVQTNAQIDLRADLAQALQGKRRLGIEVLGKKNRNLSWGLWLSQEKNASNDPVGFSFFDTRSPDYKWRHLNFTAEMRVYPFAHQRFNRQEGLFLGLHAGLNYVRSWDMQFRYFNSSGTYSVVQEGFSLGAHLGYKYRISDVIFFEASTGVFVYRASEYYETFEYGLYVSTVYLDYNDYLPSEDLQLHFSLSIGANLFRK